MLRRFIIPSVIIRRNVSALFVTGDKAKEQFAVLTPVMNFEERFGNIEELHENIKRRQLNINIEDVMTEYSIYKSIEGKKKSIEKRRNEISQHFKQNPSDTEVEGLKIQAVHLREELKTLKENSYHFEDQFVHNYLNLPNLIHKQVPQNLEVIYNFKDELKSDEVKMEDNLDDFIEYFDSTCYYLKGEASKFDLLMPMKALDAFTTKSYVTFSNPDFVRSVIFEGARVSNDDIFLIKEHDIENKLNSLHLSGNASFINYLGYITKLTVFPSLLPLKFVCSGKQYLAKNHQDSQDLYNAVQSTCVQTFVADVNGNTFDEIVEDHIERFQKIFEPFNKHFRIVKYPANQLEPAESFKIGVEMYSPSKKSYIQVANLSYYDNFISKRLLFNYKEGKKFHYPHIYSGTAVNVLKLLLVLIENNRSFKCPEFLNI
jgi:seryl-tRNA synthetase